MAIIKSDCWYINACDLANTGSCNEHCLRYMEMKYLMQTSGIPAKRQYPQLLTPDRQDLLAFRELASIKADISNFVENGENLYIASSVTGNGKTTWAIKLLTKYFDTIWAGNGFRMRGSFIHVPTFLNQLKNFNVKDTEFEEFKRDILKVDLVVWDDIASTGISQYDHSQLLSYIDQRVFEQKSNIYTGNLLKDDLEKSLGARLASRIWNGSTVITFKGQDRRKA